MKTQKKLFQHERINKILNYIRLKGRGTVDELAKKFTVTKATIRRDLTFIENNYNLKRTHGGIILHINDESEFQFNKKYKQNYELKKAIAKAAANFVNESMSVAIDGGSTNFYVAQEILNINNLTIITNSLPIIYSARNSNAEVITLGGTLRKKSLAMVGGMTVENIKSIKTNIGFLGTTGIDLEGNLFSPSMDEAVTKKSFMQSIDFKVVVFDSTKIGITSLSKFGNIAEFDLVLTNDNITPSQKNLLNNITKKIKYV